MTTQIRGRGRPRKDGQPNKSTQALMSSPVKAKPVKVTNVQSQEVETVKPMLGKFPKPEAKAALVNKPVEDKGSNDEAAIGPDQSKRIEEAFKHETQLPVYDDHEVPEPLKHVDVKKSVSVTIHDFMKSLYK
jgi:hypothetical protein